MAKIFPTPPARESSRPAVHPLLSIPQTFHPQRTELYVREDAGFIPERTGDDGVGGPIEWVDEEFPRVWRKDI